LARYHLAAGLQRLQAMTIRIATWLAIVGLLFLQARWDARQAKRRTRSAV
jgi:hypothetical protein